MSYLHCLFEFEHLAVDIFQSLSFRYDRCGGSLSESDKFTKAGKWWRMGGAGSRTLCTHSAEEGFFYCMALVLIAKTSQNWDFNSLTSLLPSNMRMGTFWDLAKFVFYFSFSLLCPSHGRKVICCTRPGVRCVSEHLVHTSAKFHFHICLIWILVWVSHVTSSQVQSITVTFNSLELMTCRQSAIFISAWCPFYFSSSPTLPLCTLIYC